MNSNPATSMPDQPATSAQDPRQPDRDTRPELAPLPGWAHSSLARLPVLSIRQPWAWAILHAGKDIENRCWPTKFRGRFLIHAAKGCTKNEYGNAAMFAWEATDGRGLIPPLATLPRGGIVGVAELVDCVNASPSPWFVGQYGFVLRNVEPLGFLPVAGALGFFRLPNDKITQPGQPASLAERGSNRA